MRLRLRIQRNELPTVSTLWPVSDTNLKSTISQLLEQVNNIFPIETDDWGYEDYGVLIGGFECLHYHEIGAVCKDEDEVIIRPLQYSEVKARTITGRDQITPDGRHLLDGVAFGRPLLKRATRPAVSIPPRKRRRISEDVDDLVEELEEPQLLLESNLLDGSDDDEDDEDYDLDMDDEDESEADLDTDDEDESEAELTPDTSSASEESQRRNEALHLAAENNTRSGAKGISISDSDGDTAEDVWNGILSSPTKKRKRTKSSSSKSSSSSPSDSSDDGSNPDSSSSDDSSEDDSDDSSEESFAEELPEKPARLFDQPQASATTIQQNGSVPKGQIQRPPRTGKQDTKERNKRRRDTRELRHLQAQDILPKNATFADLRDYIARRRKVALGAEPKIVVPDRRTPGSTAATHVTDGQQVRGTAEAFVNSPTIDGATEETSPDTMDHLPSNNERPIAAELTLEARRQQLLSAIEGGGFDVTEGRGQPRPRAIAANTSATRFPGPESDDDDNEPPEELSAKEAPSSGPQAEVMDMPQSTPEDLRLGESATKAMGTVTPSSAKNSRRVKLDLASSARLVFGSLGVRVPKTQDQKDKLQQKLAVKGKRPMHTGKQIEEAQGEEADEQNDENFDWCSRLNLTAVECCEEGLNLSTPPFPFYQRWDPQQRKGKGKKRNAKLFSEPSKRRKHWDGMDGSFIETYDKYNTSGGGDALNYDDVEEDEAYWEEGALLDEVYGDDNDGDEYVDTPGRQLLDETVAQEIEDDLPPLPADFGTLPLLKDTDVKEKDLIVFSRLEVSAATGWQPAHSPTRTATVTSVTTDEGGRVKDMVLELAKRDLPTKRYDEDGNRVYSKFEMQGYSDAGEEEDDDGNVEVMWSELVEPRLLLRKEPSVAVTEDSIPS